MDTMVSIGGGRGKLTYTALKAIGGVYSRDTKWQVPSAQVEAAKAIIAAAVSAPKVEKAPNSERSTVVVAHSVGCGKAMKELGAKWDGGLKAWQVPSARAAEARAL